VTTHSDVLILGGGSGGYACALRASQLGLSVVLIEADKVGGTCLHRGCIPTKALLHAAEIADTSRTARSFGICVDVTGVDMPAVHAYKDSVVDRLHRGLEGLISSRGITVVRGTGRYLGNRTVDVGGTAYTGSSVVLATGSEPREISGIGLDDRIITSDQAMQLSEVPRSAIVLGGGVIGVEFASLWASFGATVTVVEALPRLVANEDPWTSQQLARAFRKRGIAAMTATKVTAVTPNIDGVAVELDSGTVLAAEIVLIAVGRAPRTSGLAEAGIVLEGEFVRVDERLATSHDGDYAVGDIVAGPQLAHRGFMHGVLVAEQISGADPVPVPDDLIPRVTYSHPEIASVGLTEAAARQRHEDVTTFVYDLGGNGRSQILRTSGGVKVIRSGSADDVGPVVGVHMVGDRIGELVGEAQLIVGWEALPSDVGRFVHAHPTQNEALGEAMLALAGSPLHTHA
jgi:dihydrolipoamide dehydrogenase